MNGKQINDAGIAIIKDFEKCSLTAYQDLGGVWTIGWGRIAGVTPGMTCTQEQADTWLSEDVASTAAELARLTPPTLSSNQFSACVSLAYNIGTGNFQHSTLRQDLLKGDLKSASDQFLVWIKVKGVPNDGLLRRRKAEQALFNTA